MSTPSKGMKPPSMPPPSSARKKRIPPPRLPPPTKPPKKGGKRGRDKGERKDEGKDGEEEGSGNVDKDNDDDGAVVKGLSSAERWRLEQQEKQEQEQEQEQEEKQERGNGDEMARGERREERKDEDDEINSHPYDTRNNDNLRDDWHSRDNGGDNRDRYQKNRNDRDNDDRYDDRSDHYGNRRVERNHDNGRDNDRNNDRHNDRHYDRYDIQYDDRRDDRYDGRHDRNGDQEYSRQQAPITHLKNQNDYRRGEEKFGHDSDDGGNNSDEAFGDEDGNRYDESDDDYQGGRDCDHDKRNDSDGGLDGLQSQLAVTLPPRTNSGTDSPPVITSAGEALQVIQRQKNIKINDKDNARRDDDDRQSTYSKYNSQQHSLGLSPKVFDPSTIPLVLRELHQFLLSPVPGGMGTQVRCFIERNRAFTKRMSPVYTIYADHEDGSGRLLVCARRLPLKGKGCHYVFSTNMDDLYRGREDRSRHYLGKLRGDGAGKFILYDRGGSPEEAGLGNWENEGEEKSDDDKVEGKKPSKISNEQRKLLRKELAVIHIAKKNGDELPERKMEVAIPSVRLNFGENKLDQKRVEVWQPVSAGESLESQFNRISHQVRSCLQCDMSQ